ncbi:MAG: transglycosylase domain-containing protein [Clostridia bacterium]|nr:transglycosylase domain-containing protein [Clostridia bacterium]
MKKIIFSILGLILLSGLVFSGITFYKGFELYQETMDGVVIGEVFLSYESQEDYVTLENIPSMFLDALIAVEDHRFMDHKGFDIVSFGRAVMRNIMEKEYAAGGSTITQQLAKNLFFSFDKTLERKVAELIVAKEIEKAFDKDTILEMYVNIIYFGDGYTGIKQASEGYFQKDPADLTDEESILLAGLPQAPSLYAMYEHFDRAVARSEDVLFAMVTHKYLLESEKDALYKKIQTIKIQVN